MRMLKAYTRFTPLYFKPFTMGLLAEAEPVPVVITKAFLSNISLLGVTVRAKKPRWSSRFFMPADMLLTPWWGVANTRASAWSTASKIGAT